MKIANDFVISSMLRRFNGVAKPQWCAQIKRGQQSWPLIHTLIKAYYLAETPSAFNVAMLMYLSTGRSLAR